MGTLSGPGGHAVGGVGGPGGVGAKVAQPMAVMEV